MKKIYLLFFTLMSLASSAQWTKLSNADYYLTSNSEGLGDLTEFNGAPVVAYENRGLSRYELLQFNGTSWVNNFIPATTFPVSSSGSVQLLVSQNQLHICYTVAANKTIVKRFNGSAWQLVGDTIQTMNVRGFIDDPSGNLYVAYLNVPDYAFTVVKLTGATWTQLGASFYAITGMDGNGLTYHNNQLYAGLMNNTVGQASVFKYTGSSWTQVGPVKPTGGLLGITFFENNKLALSTTSGVDSLNVATNNWVSIGASGSMGVDASNRLIIANNTGVKRLAAGGLQPVGNFNDASLNYLRLGVFGNELYINGVEYDQITYTNNKLRAYHFSPLAPSVGTINDVVSCPPFPYQDTIVNIINFSVSDDAGTASNNLSYSVGSSNTSFIANNLISIQPASQTITIKSLGNNPGTTTITLTITDNDGMSTSESFDYTIHPYPAVQISQGNSLLICATQNFTLSVGGASTYSWTPATALSCSNCATPVFNSSVNMAYIVTGTDALGCQNTDTISITLKQPVSQSICMVTVDSLSTHNIIAWEKPIGGGIDSFRIYREDLTNVYTLIATVAYDSLSEYHDLDPAANPNSTTKRYKMSALDTCGNEGPLSDYHNTIYVNHLGSGVFQWNTYTIENQANPVTLYALYRDDISNGTWNLVGTTAGTQNIIVDANYSSFPNASYRIETLWSITCTPTRGAINTSRSNIKSPNSVGIKEAINTANIVLSPNPANTTLQLSGDVKSITKVSIVDALGRNVLEVGVHSSESTLSMDVSTLQAGVYTAVIIGKNVKATKKLVIE